MTANAFELWDRPVLVAPMGGGPTTHELVAAAADAGGFAFLAGGYKLASELDADIRALREVTTKPFGVNVFVPGSPTTDAATVGRYLRELEPEANQLGVPLGEPRWSVDEWAEKIDVLVEAAPAVASFTFGHPPGHLAEALRRRGVLVMVTVTNAAEAEAAVRHGADVLCAQGVEAGAHRGTFDDGAADDELPTLDLIAAITSREVVPVIGAGGMATPAHVAAALRAGPSPCKLGQPSSAATRPAPARSTEPPSTTPAMP